ncbi:MAG: hypothetical protein GYA46_07250 [candidate division Zixibacteria bacterium]|nr:hypothetical protein [candidate division Zixibacteria bacterium]
MNITGVLIALAAVCVAWFVVTSLCIFDNLRRRGRPVNFLLLRLLLFSYVSQYREVTIMEDGRVGPLFYHWIVSINLALVLVLASVVASR